MVRIDLAGYRVFRGSTATVDTTGTGLGGSTPLSASSFIDTTVVNGQTYYYVVKAVDEAGNASQASAAVSATPSVQVPGSGDLAVNFQAETTATPSGYAIGLSWRSRMDTPSSTSPKVVTLRGSLRFI